jgi:hypothetical protein
MPNAKKDVSGYKHALSYLQNTLKFTKKSPRGQKNAFFSRFYTKQKTLA